MRPQVFAVARPYFRGSPVRVCVRERSRSLACVAAVRAQRDFNFTLNLLQLEETASLSATFVIELQLGRRLRESPETRAHLLLSRLPCCAREPQRARHECDRQHDAQKTPSRRPEESVCGDGRGKFLRRVQLS